VAVRALGFELSAVELKEMLSRAQSGDSVAEKGGSKGESGGSSSKTVMIDYDEFENLVKDKILGRNAGEELRKAFKLFDTAEKGSISFEDLKRVAKELGENMSDTEIQDMIDEADRSNSGSVSEEDFLRIMSKTNLW